MFRTDAQAAAMEVRRVFQFEAVDATPLGWSSESVAMLLMQLLSLHEEHSDKLHTESYYPVRLVLTSDDFENALDLYGGVLRLNPALTKLQWLNKLQLVTPEKLDGIKSNRTAQQEMLGSVQSAMGVRMRKGFSCTNQEFFHFLERMSRVARSVKDASNNNDVGIEASALILEPVAVTVDAPQACRKPIVTKDGSIRLGSGMTEHEVMHAIAKLSPDARKQAAECQKEREQCKTAIDQIQWELGLQRVYRTATVDNNQFLDCLGRILQVSEAEQKQRLRVSFTGNSLGIASTGHFCHLADDGSVVIPHDWR